MPKAREQCARRFRTPDFARFGVYFNRNDGTGKQCRIARSGSKQMLQRVLRTLDYG
jgi:hypothetical protein